MTAGDRAADYDFALPPERIAQHPASRRDASRLMVVERATGRITERVFRDLAALPVCGDALVLNTTRVFRARLKGTRDSGAPGEVLLLDALGEGRFEAMVHPGGKLRAGRRLHVAPGFYVDVEAVTERRTRIVTLHAASGSVAEAIEQHGHVPLPPYITRADTNEDAERYQTVFARETGSVAAPTAGLHFTPELLAALEARGVRRVDVLLHVGAGTFKPVEVDRVADHVMHEERYVVSEAAARALNDTRAAGGQIWAVGTTAARTLESIAAEDGTFRPAAGQTRIFIHPPYRFRGVDRLITNFHLPRSTLLMLVAAFAGYDLTMRAYETAVHDGYRFYSYGDAMALV